MKRPRLTRYWPACCGRCSGLTVKKRSIRHQLLAAFRTVLPGAPETNLAEWVALVGQILGVRVNDAAIAGLEAKVRRKNS